MSKTKKLTELKQLIESANLSLVKAEELISDLVGGKEGQADVIKAAKVGSIKEEEAGRIIEGVFDGQEMIGPDGKKYSVPANYASKSKLVEGDILKLTINKDGSFIFKQIGPVRRTRLKGVIHQDKDTGEFRVLAEGKSYKVLLASITYFQGEEADEAVILVPQDKSSTWAAVENVIKKFAAPAMVMTEEQEARKELRERSEKDIEVDQLFPEEQPSASLQQSTSEDSSKQKATGQDLVLDDFSLTPGDNTKHLDDL